MATLPGFGTKVGFRFKSTPRQLRILIGKQETMRRGLVKVSKELSLDMARALKKQIGRQMRQLRPYSSAKHNTPVHISQNWMKFVSFKQSTKSLDKDVRILTIKSSGKGSNKMNPLWVEFGTQPHAQPNNPKHSAEGHPGAKRRPFLLAAQKEFYREDLPRIEKKVAKLVFGSESAK